MRESATTEQSMRVRSATFPSRLGSPLPELRVFIATLLLLLGFFFFLEVKWSEVKNWGVKASSKSRQLRFVWYRRPVTAFQASWAPDAAATLFHSVFN
jgi:hypothetical protein